MGVKPQAHLVLVISATEPRDRLSKGGRGKDAPMEGGRGVVLRLYCQRLGARTPMEGYGRLLWNDYD